MLPPSFLLFSLLSLPNRSQQTAAPLWAWFWLKPLPVKSQFFLLTVTSSFLTGFVAPSLYTTVSYNLSPKEMCSQISFFNTATLRRNVKTGLLSLLQQLNEKVKNSFTLKVKGASLVWWKWAVWVWHLCAKQMGQHWKDAWLCQDSPDIYLHLQPRGHSVSDGVVHIVDKHWFQQWVKP